MASLASSQKVADPLDAPTRLRLTMSASLDKIPVPGMWSQGPVYRRLDSDFLERPLIPKAPLAPRLRIDRINGSMRVFDAVHSPELSEMPPTVSLPQLEQPPQLQLPEAESARGKPRLWYQALAVAVGFAAGLAAAFLFGWL